MSYQTKQPRTIYVLPPRKILSSTPIAPTNGQFHAKPTTTYRLIRPNYTLPPVAPQQPKLVPKVEQKPILKRPNDDVISALLGESMEPSGPRKRERLTHLTAEEKMDRRKMKNRMAAQTARDKKKERSQKMEDVMKSIVDENRKLRTENLRLRQEIEEMRRSQNLRMYSVGNVENRSSFGKRQYQSEQPKQEEYYEPYQIDNSTRSLHSSQCVQKQEFGLGGGDNFDIGDEFEIEKIIEDLKSSDIDLDRLCNDLPSYYEEDPSTSSSSSSYEPSPSQNSQISQQFADPLSDTCYWDSPTPTTEVLLGDPDFGYSTKNQMTTDPFLTKPETKPDISSPLSSNSSFVDPNDFEYWTRESTDLELFNEKLY
ncbi:unnamed protein product [Caenorhabditis angaria]|uniref:X-box-binding protein 1 n=1 Tax=Caenorhabditis angaria TaxID=860376 RepID=A0A9P1IM74_9PELO|nr:unnamed protein product [Caenorhabditis angaria]